MSCPVVHIEFDAFIVSLWILSVAIIKLWPSGSHSAREITNSSYQSPRIMNKGKGFPTYRLQTSLQNCTNDLSSFSVESFPNEIQVMNMTRIQNEMESPNRRERNVGKSCYLFLLYQQVFVVTSTITHMLHFVGTLSFCSTERGESPFYY